jgi:hypothetical protein
VKKGHELERQNLHVAYYMFSTKNPKNSENPRHQKKEKKASHHPMYQGLSRPFLPTLWPSSYMG